MCSRKDYFYTSNCYTGTYNCIGNLISVSQLALWKYDDLMSISQLELRKYDK